jgi:hypothetical protein
LIFAERIHSHLAVKLPEPMYPGHSPSFVNPSSTVVRCVLAESTDLKRACRY